MLVYVPSALCTKWKIGLFPTYDESHCCGPFKNKSSLHLAETQGAKEQLGYPRFWEILRQNLFDT